MFNELSISFKYTEREYVKADRLITNKNNHIIRDLIISFFVMGISIYEFVNSGYSIISISGAIAGLLFLLVVLLLNFVIPVLKFRRHSKFNDDYHLTFNDQGIVFRTTNIGSELNWDYYTNAFESNEFFYLVYGKDLYTIIPKRAFVSSEMTDSFRRLLNNKMELKQL